MQIILNTCGRVELNSGEDWLPEVVLRDAGTFKEGEYRADKVVIQLGDKRIVVMARQLKAAIEALEKVAG